jgi:predicted O-methyltransferase YrrM
VRYDYILEALRDKKPKSILEIGTWNGRRALEMLMVCPDAKYYGFDLFEDADAFTDAEEKNVKPHYTLRGVKAYLDGFDVVLHKGNTRATLPDFNKPVDFVWLDGGHSVETIRSDWENVQRVITPGAVVLFDDYYTGPIDTRRYGCNEVVKDLNHVVLPQADPVSGGGFVQMVRVWAS